MAEANGGDQNTERDSRPVYSPTEGPAEGQPVAEIFSIHVGKRHREDLGDITDLAMDLNENGQFHPILVRSPIPEYDEPNGWTDEPYVLVTGGRRMAAALRLLWTHIAIFHRVDIVTIEAHLIAELHENVKRHDMNWQEQAAIKKKLLELRREQDPTITAKEVAYEIGDNPSSFSRDVDVATAIEEKPELAKAASRKSALRRRDAGALLEARIKRAEESKEVLTTVGEHIETEEAEVFLQKYDGFFDICITDPPWGIEYFKAGEKSGNRQEDYDDSAQSAERLYRRMFPVLARSMRETGWVLMFGGIEAIQAYRNAWSDTCSVHYGARQIGHAIRALMCENCGDVPGKCEWYSPETIPWIWYRENSRNPSRFPERLAQNMYEYILVLNMGKAMLAKPTQNVFVEDSVYGDERVHANQKPVDLGIQLLESIGYPGDRFVDPCFGSGAFLAAASSRSMFPYGCDSDPAMLEPAKGLTVHHYKEAPPSVRDLSEVRFKQRLEEITFDAEPPRGELEDGGEEAGSLHDDGEEA